MKVTCDSIHEDHFLLTLFSHHRRPVSGLIVFIVSNSLVRVLQNCQGEPLLHTAQTAHKDLARAGAGPLALPLVEARLLFLGPCF